MMFRTSDPADESPFFAGSDEDEGRHDVAQAPEYEHLSEVEEPAISEPASEAASRQGSEPLFLPESDDENAAESSTGSGEDMILDAAHEKLKRVSGSDSDDVEILELEGLRRSGRHSGVSSRASNPPTHLSPPAMFNSMVQELPSKKRRLSSESPLPACSSSFTSAFLGTFIVPNAWSTVRGKGYIKVRIKICPL
jgi:DNA repair protein RAD5